jgi:hypothetical protein
MAINGDHCPMDLTLRWRRPCMALVFIVACFQFQCFTSSAQTDRSAPNTVTKFPYTFTNFPWWSDANLRDQLRRRIPTLGDELPRSLPMEAKIRMALVELLKEKGIHAEVQTFELPMDTASAKRVPNAPPPSIAFSILAPPEIRVEKLNVENPPPNLPSSLNGTIHAIEGRAYNTDTFWSQKADIKESLEQAGYLSAEVEFLPGTPKKAGEGYVVPITARISDGPQYHVSNVKAEGGPLLSGKDLSPYFSLKPGDVAQPSAFGRLVGSIRSVYWHAGYADVDFHSQPILDPAHALASYQLEVIPGPLYHLRNLTFKNLNAVQESQARDILGIKSGDVYDALAVDRLSQKLSGSLAGSGFTYSPTEDKTAHLVDLTLEFYKK